MVTKKACAALMIMRSACAALKVPRKAFEPQVVTSKALAAEKVTRRSSAALGAVCGELVHLNTSTRHFCHGGRLCSLKYFVHISREKMAAGRLVRPASCQISRFYFLDTYISSDSLNFWQPSWMFQKYLLVVILFGFSGNNLMQLMEHLISTCPS